MPLLKLLGLGTGEPTPLDGEFVVEYDPTREGISPDGRKMICHLVTTPDPAQAKQFADAGQAFEYWRLEHGERPDGQPNRPLTAYSVEIV